MNETLASLYVLFEGRRGERRPISARPRAPRSGIKVRVEVEYEAVEAAQVFLLHRKGDGDMVLGASARKERMEQLRDRLGRSAEAWEITAIPVLPRLEQA